MLGITKVTIRPNLPLIGKDLDAEATFNADVVGAEPDLFAGTLMLYTPPANPALPGSMVRVTLPAQITDVTLMIGILAADSFYDEQPVGTPINRPAMIYRGGTFIRSTINEVNGGYAPPLVPLPPINPGDNADKAMNLRGMYLEESWDENQYP